MPSCELRFKPRLKIKALLVFTSKTGASQAIIQHLAHLGCQARHRERLLNEINSFVEHSVVSDDVGGISRHEQSLDVGKEGKYFCSQAVHQEKSDLASVFNCHVNGFIRGGCRQHGVSLPCENHHNNIQDSRLVFHQHCKPHVFAGHMRLKKGEAFLEIPLTDTTPGQRTKAGLGVVVGHLELFMKMRQIKDEIRLSR